MVWKADGPQGSEADKVRSDVVEFFKGRCLDLGCGPRKIFPSKDVVGVDNNKDALLFGIKTNPDMPGNVEKLDMFADGTMDTVFSSHTLEHVEDHVAVLREWWRLLKVGGYLVLYLPHADWYPNRGMPGANPDHQHDFRNEDINHSEGTRTRTMSPSFVVVDRVADNIETGDRLDPLVDDLVDAFTAQPQLVTGTIWDRMTVADIPVVIGEYEFAGVRFTIPDVTISEGRD